jgi:hypothetical protein
MPTVYYLETDYCSDTESVYSTPASTRLNPYEILDSQDDALPPMQRA